MAIGFIDEDQTGSTEIRSRGGRLIGTLVMTAGSAVELYRSSDGVAVSNISQQRAERRTLPSWDASGSKAK
jgi:hypothetical protein